DAGGAVAAVDDPRPRPNPAGGDDARRDGPGRLPVAAPGRLAVTATGLLRPGRFAVMLHPSPASDAGPARERIGDASGRFLTPSPSPPTTPQYPGGVGKAASRAPARTCPESTCRKSNPAKWQMAGFCRGVGKRLRGALARQWVTALAVAGRLDR